MKSLIIFFMLFISLNYAQKSIRGVILSAEDLSPLYLANVILEDRDIGAVTERDGSFELFGDIRNSDILIVSFVGFTSKKIPLAEFESDERIIVTLDRKVISSQTVLVLGSLGSRGVTPVTFSKIERKEIEESYTLQDIPEYISYFPSTTFYSENGNGLGYNYLSIRGFDQRRISVSVNGIPQNDPEDHNIYWLDLPDLIGSTELIQVQRGAGSGLSGYPAIGGSINIITSSFSDRREFSFQGQFGSFNTRKYTASFASGLIDSKYSVYTRLSQTLSGGYRQNSWIDFKSYNVSIVRYDEDLVTQLNIYGGPVADGLAFNGIAKFAVKDRNLRKENLSYWEAEDGRYTYKAIRRPDEKENFSQPHFELLNELNLTESVTFNSALFLVNGNGFFDYDGSWGDTTYFRLTAENGFNPASNPENVLIRAMVENTQWGWIPRISIGHDKGNLILGGELRFHKSLHWGSLNYGENLPAGLTKDFRYYYYEGAKDIINFFVHEQYSINERLNLLGEVQFAYHKYGLHNEKYLNTEFSIGNFFVNPRLGINYKFSEKLSSYLGLALVSREPRLKTYYDAAESSGGAVPQFGLNSDGSYDFNDPLVKPERMINAEIGASYKTALVDLSLNIFYMQFNDEIVNKGQVDRFGQPITGNIDRTVHAGIELGGSVKLNESFEMVFNGSYSNNYVSEGSTFFTYTGKDPNGNDVSKVGEIDLSGNTLGGFPEYILNAVVKYRLYGWTTQLFAKYVGGFFSDNYDKYISDYLNRFPGFIDYKENKVDGYFSLNLITSYEFKSGRAFEKIRIFLQVNNVLDNLYAAYAIGKEFFPSAERNFIAGIEIGI